MKRIRESLIEGGIFTLWIGLLLGIFAVAMVLNHTGHIVWSAVFTLVEIFVAFTGVIYISKGIDR